MANNIFQCFTLFNGRFLTDKFKGINGNHEEASSVVFLPIMELIDLSIIKYEYNVNCKFIYYYFYFILWWLESLQHFTLMLIPSTIVHVCYCTSTLLRL